MKKRLLMIIAVAVLLVGCGNQQEVNNNITEQPTTTEASTSTPTETPTPAPTETPTPTPTETPIPTPTETPTPTPTEPPHEHTYTESTSKEATCTEAGEKTFTCDCGDTYTEPIKETGHDYKTVAGSEVKETCEADGKKADTKCSLCGDTIKGAIVSATGHSYGKYTYNNDATYEKDGTETATCSACGKTKTRTKDGTKLVKEEPETSDDGHIGILQPDGKYLITRDQCPYPLYEVEDNWTSISWYFINGDPDFDETAFGYAQTDMFRERHNVDYEGKYEATEYTLGKGRLVKKITFYIP